jgi:hypothetical protein
MNTAGSRFDLIVTGIQECLRMLLNKSIYKPEVFTDKMQCYIWENHKITPIRYLLAEDHDGFS